ncbi:MAG: histidine kinase [Proteobacteria bacterium]|nr:histidine kinase [Pseudomonadota bacterium]
MQEIEPELSRPRVPVSTVLASIAGLWACYFVLTTVRAEILDLGFEFELLWRRVLVALIGVAVTFAMWLILRLFDLKPLWIKVAAALVIAAPVSVVLAQANRLVFADIEAQIVGQPRRRKPKIPKMSPRRLMKRPLPVWLAASPRPKRRSSRSPKSRSAATS